MQKFTMIFATALLVLGSGTVMAKQHRTYRPAIAPPPPYYAPSPYYAAPSYYGSPISRAQRTWPGVALCDDGGGRIRPCDVGGPLH